MNRCRLGALVPVDAWQWMGGDEYLSHPWQNYAKKDRPAASGLFYACTLPFVGFLGARHNKHKAHLLT